MGLAALPFSRLPPRVLAPAACLRRILIFKVLMKTIFLMTVLKIITIKTLGRWPFTLQEKKYGCITYV